VGIPQARLNAGSGWQRLDGWINLDVTDADIRAAVTALPFRDATITRIYASHLLEHLDYTQDLPRALAEFGRVLTPDGQLCVVGPDIERAVLTGQPPHLLRSIVSWPPEFGDTTGPGGHRWTATGPLTERALTDAGFTARSYSGRLGDLVTLGWPVAVTAAWQHGYLAVKET
jgi:SAM-dependent methyltransferase